MLWTTAMLGLALWVAGFVGGVQSAAGPVRRPPSGPRVRGSGAPWDVGQPGMQRGRC